VFSTVLVKRVELKRYNAQRYLVPTFYLAAQLDKGTKCTHIISLFLGRALGLEIPGEQENEDT
jgi:hypothetical protein